MLFNTVAPVVVNPDIASKKASVTELIVPFKRKGNIPNTAKTTQVKVTIRKESLTSKPSISCLVLPDFRPAEININPEMAVMIVETVNAKTSPSPHL